MGEIQCRSHLKFLWDWTPGLSPELWADRSSIGNFLEVLRMKICSKQSFSLWAAMNFRSAKGTCNGQKKDEERSSSFSSSWEMSGIWLSSISVLGMEEVSWGWWWKPQLSLTLRTSILNVFHGIVLHWKDVGRVLFWYKHRCRNYHKLHVVSLQQV